MAEGSQDTAARVRFVRNDPRKSVDARIQAVSEDGGRFTVAIAPKESGEATKREFKITEKTRLVFFNVGLGGAKPAEGYHVRGWLVEGADDTADELMLSRPEKTAPKKSDDKKPDDKKPSDKKPSDKKPSDKKPSDKKPDDKKPDDKKPSDKQEK
jgi:hypothetical protein